MDVIQLNKEWKNYSEVYSAIDSLSFVKKLHNLHLGFANKLGHVLDAGCGPGLLTKKLAKNCGKITAIDINPDMLRHAGIILRGIPNIKLHAGSVCNLDFPKSSFDGYVSNNVLHFVEDRDSFFSEMLRVTKKGGIMTISSARRCCDIEVLIKSIIDELGDDPNVTKTAQQIAMSNRQLIKEVKTLLDPFEVSKILKEHGCKILKEGSTYLGQSFFVAAVR